MWLCMAAVLAQVPSAGERLFYALADIAMYLCQTVYSCIHQVLWRTRQQLLQTQADHNTRVLLKRLF